MMRNVAIGAVLGFGLVVGILMFVGREAPPPLPATTEQPATKLEPTNVAPVINTPTLVRNRPPLNAELLRKLETARAAGVVPMPVDAGQ